MHDVMTGNISQEESACMRERRKQIDSTYDEFIKANGGKNPILGWISIERLSQKDKKDLLNFSCGEDDKENQLNSFFHSDKLFRCDKHHLCSVYVVR